MITTTETESTITLSNFRVTYRAPRYEDGKVLYDGYCTILADDAEHDGAEVRVFDVPDVDEGQLAAALFACDAMNAHADLMAALTRIIDRGCAWDAEIARTVLNKIQPATTTSK